MKIAALNDWFNSRTLRERLVLFVAVAALLGLVVYLLVFEPQLKHQRRLTRQLDVVHNEVRGFAAQEAVIRDRNKVNPDLQNMERINQLQSELEQLQKKLDVNIANLVSPQQMIPLLKELLKQKQSLTLLNLNNQSPQLIDISSAAEPDQEGPKLYKHGLVMELSGTYRALLSYLEELQELPRTLIWEAVEIETQEYPAAVIRVKLYTLSLTEGFIGG